MTRPLRQAYILTAPRRGLICTTVVAEASQIEREVKRVWGQVRPVAVALWLRSEVPDHPPLTWSPTWTLKAQYKWAP